MKIIAVKTPAYAENGLINCMVEVEGLDGIYPFTSSPDDSEAHGRQLYADLKAGKYGPVTPFTVTPEMIQAAKDAKRAEINNWRDTQENGSIIFTLNGHRWDCGKASQTRLAPVVAVAKSGALPPGFFWTDADNIDVPMTADELTALEAAMQQNMVLQGFKIHERQRQMKEEVDKLTDYRAIQTYTVGWPEGN
ncbi:DUF4376 domain-containing protein [Salmonella enterica subsp. enterica serovar Muenchen]|uniref:DUF4376 domain-containing protein n=1 Tax=Salmonella enterica TaxID=28901 RepID=UPI00127D8CE5|nr:DUF4376 domain-containing protein [Salmonella enterica]ECI3890496.1 DUF4376 domain-containing protein [Salmonella enterica subsp. enterica serovar Gombe]ECY7601111.1 DUF4376 domain-containing protein [Salmonella enterica subsp. enterica serovar Muenchen]EEJ6213096.1 DUF4376 domain-containing protein [Salmonella enterica]MCH5440329.1 DUF4376 domain-containing protein [Salmonella enterica subsp. enterica serovar Muenchen]HDC2547238.1 DUF4376 domain-containing protein [Salmonella enterica]